MEKRNSRDSVQVATPICSEGVTDAGVVTESIVEDDEAEDIEQSENEGIERIEDNEGVEPGP